MKMTMNCLDLSKPRDVRQLVTRLDASSLIWALEHHELDYSNVRGGGKLRSNFLTERE
jgi:hypothetical protein